jgi:hypothetical protein
VPGVRSPRALTLTLPDDPSALWWSVLEGAAESRAKYPMRIDFPNGTRLVACARVEFNTWPDLNINRALTVSAVFSLCAAPIRYSAT